MVMGQAHDHMVIGQAHELVVIRGQTYELMLMRHVVMGAGYG